MINLGIEKELIKGFDSIDKQRIEDAIKAGVWDYAEVTITLRDGTTHTFWLNEVKNN